MAEEMSDFHLCSTLEIKKKEDNLLEDMLFVLYQCKRCNWRQTLVSNVQSDYQNTQQTIVLIIKYYPERNLEQFGVCHSAHE